MKDSRKEKFNEIVDRLSKIDKSKLTQLFNDIDSASLKDSENELEDLVDILMMFFFVQTMNIKKGFQIWRARKNKGKQRFKNLSDLTYPPAKIVTDRGRLNKPYQRLYYATNQESYAIMEVLNNTQHDEPIGYCTTVRSIKINDDDILLANLYPGTKIRKDTTKPAKKLLQDSDGFDEYLKEITSQDVHEKVNMIRYYVSERIRSYDISKKFDCYKITSIIANILFEKFKKHGRKIDGIIYPTAILFGTSPCVAFRPESYDKHFRPIQCYLIDYEFNSVTKNQPTSGYTFFSYSHNYYSSWKDKDGDIIWKACPPGY